jgi:hypothetical protein
MKKSKVKKKSVLEDEWERGTGKNYKKQEKEKKCRTDKGK